MDLVNRILNRDFSLLDERLVPVTQEDVDIDNPLTLFILFSAAQQVQFKEVLPWLLDNLLSDEDGQIEPEAKLFLQRQLPSDMIQYIVDNMSSRFALATVMDSFIHMDSNMETYEACKRAVEILGDTDYPSWVSFANEADYQDNATVWLFCSQQARRTAPFAAKPKYIRDFNPEASKPLEWNKETERMVDYITRISEDPEMFRTWGPSNFLFDATEEDVTDGTADLRMFIDERFTPEEQGSWFTGSCDQCWLRIHKSRYAARKPKPSGGWEGQFCSWNCVRDNCQPFEEPSLKMIDYYEKQMSSLGIYDNIIEDPDREDEVLPVIPLPDVR